MASDRTEAACRRRYAHDDSALNDGCDYSHRVGAGLADITLVDFLAEHYLHSGRDEWLRRIAEGAVTVDGRFSEAATILVPGQRVTWHRPPWREPAAPLDFRVVHEDAELLAVSKPAGLPTLAGAGFLRHTLQHQVRRRFPGAAAAHRLGRWTSGLVLFGRTPAARAVLARQLRCREIRKRYVTIARGRPAWRRRRIALPIGPLPYAPLGTIHAASVDGRPALTEVAVTSRGRDDFLCEVEIASGRAHQIRIHLAAVGHPLDGDPLYAAGGRPTPTTTALPGDPGYRLHASGLDLAHPASGRPLVLRDSPPADWGRISPRRS